MFTRSKLVQTARLCARLASDTTNGRLSGKVAVVTASTEGIGYAIARRLGQDGAKVMISSRKQKNVDRALAELRSENLEVSGMVCHAGKSEDRVSLIEETVKQYGGLDILVSNAAANPIFGPILDSTSEQAWDKIFDINVKAAFFFAKEAAPHIEKRGGGSIVFVTSIAGFAPFELLGAYSVSKTALLGLTKAMVPQLAGMNINVNAIAPGVIKTGFSETLWKTPEIAEEALKTIPSGRFGVPEDCAGTVSFLVSKDGQYITGETVAITGGMQSRL
ncbi:unnamed protein product [Owenia fusiformis]|uniref:Dehydrogenase/reductase SDR family member 4 n=1 Tax=Owenia fusiformis TaxID=6347 RepID=A0A8S4NE82_OWEFU|nr:unnamed protein product [Owenia fusiformis]